MSLNSFRRLMCFHCSRCRHASILERFRLLTRSRAMWNALRVLLHRPLVADGSLHVTLPSTSKSSFSACTEAAINIVKLVRLYDKAFSVRRAPYLISYATYVAATIHVRIAATRTSSSEAHEHLRTCLSVFAQNSETNYAVRKASIVVEALMKRMGVSIGTSDTGKSEPAETRAIAESGVSSNFSAVSPTGLHSHTSVASQPLHFQTDLANLANPEPTMVAGQIVPDLDVDAIIHSFMQDQQLAPAAHGPLSFGGPISYPSDSHQPVFLNMDQQNTSRDMFNFDDTLFGFNASAFDWFQPGPMHS